MSPQRSNRAKLVEGALRCLERLPPEQVTARAIAAEAGANLASITYHFGSKEQLVTEAAVTGLDRWLEDISARLAHLHADEPSERFRRAHEIVEASRRDHFGLARNYVAALAMGQHDERVRRRLAAGFHRSRADVAALLGLGDDQAGMDSAGLVLSMFHGLLIQVLLDDTLAIDGERMGAAQTRAAVLFPSEASTRTSIAQPTTRRE
jgi:AcrR family transcriptional regulator